MAKGKSHSMFGDAVSGRLPENYGDVEGSPLKKMDMSKARETSKTFAAESPHPKAKQEEGPAGRKTLGSEEYGVKQEHFNRVREEAHKMGKKSY